MLLYMYEHLCLRSWYWHNGIDRYYLRSKFVTVYPWIEKKHGYKSTVLFMLDALQLFLGVFHLRWSCFKPSCYGVPSVLYWPYLIVLSQKLQTLTHRRLKLRDDLFYIFPFRFWRYISFPHSQAGLLQEILHIYAYHVTFSAFLIHKQVYRKRYSISIIITWHTHFSPLTGLP